MTASWIADGLSVSEVTINWLYAETLVKYLFDENPMPHIEYSRAGHSFDQMKKLNELYETEEYFSNKV